jgi:YD repeat-containing protein
MPDYVCLNSDRRHHAAIYGMAFYDLVRAGQAGQVPDDLEAGNTCLVATPTTPEGEEIEFGWFTFSHTQEMTDPDTRIKVPVLFGKLTKWELLSRADVVTKDPYSRFFARNGRFNRGLSIKKV